MDRVTGSSLPRIRYKPDIFSYIYSQYYGCNHKYEIQYF